MTKEEFETRYISLSNITPEFYHAYFVTLPCDCDADVCEGWAAIHNTPEMVELHNELYAPRVHFQKHRDTQVQ